MSRRLGSSLSHIYEQSRDPAGLPSGIVDPLVAALAAGKPVAPETFAIHSDILSAVGDDDMDWLHELFIELGSSPATSSGRTIRQFDATAFSTTSRDRYLRYAATDPDVPLALTAPHLDEFIAFKDRIGAALALISRGAPELVDELDAVVGEIVVATVDEADAERQFDGISVFDLWGALFLNPRRHVTVLETAEVLVHEATHALLFGYCLDEPLVLNPMTERYASPVREDARPMDGVFHGTYVIAMLHYLLTRLVDSDVLSHDERKLTLERLAIYGEPFEAGIKVIQDHGRMTDTGRRILAGAQSYMATAAR